MKKDQTNDEEVKLFLKSDKCPGNLQTWLISGVLIFTSLLYTRTLFNGLTSYDDSYYLQKNYYLRDPSLEGIKAIFTSFYASNYHPLTTLTYLFEYTFWELNPFPYHLINLLLHIINTFLVFKLTSRLSGNWTSGFIVCTLFALTPMHVESVAWASERKDVLYAMFYLLATIHYLKYLNAGKKGNKYYFNTLLLFILSLLSKATAVTLPVLLLAIDIYKSRKISYRTLIEKIPFLVLSILFGVLNMHAQQSAMTDMDQTYNLVNRFFLVCSSISFYLLKLVLPINLSLVHFFPGTENGLLPWYYYTSLPFLLLLILLLRKLKTYRREILFGVAFFLISISVMLQLIPVGSAYAAERYSYIPYIGLFYIPAQWVAANFERSHKILVPVFIVVIIIFSTLTWQRIGVWENDDTLFGDIRRKDPVHAARLARRITMTGNDKKVKNELEGAYEDYSQALLFDPEFGEAYFFRAMVNNDLGNLKEAISDYTEAIRLNLRPPLIFQYRGIAYYRNGHADSAIIDYGTALKMEPGNKTVYHLRGLAYLQMRDTATACIDLKKATQLGDSTALSLTDQLCRQR